MMTKTLSPHSTRRLEAKPGVAATGLLRNMIIGAIACALSAGIWTGLADLPGATRIVFITFALAILGWTATRINDTYIGLVAALVCLFATQETPNNSLTPGRLDDLVVAGVIYRRCGG